MLQQVWKTTGVKPDELNDVPEFPIGLSYLWGWFCELQDTADKVITFHDILAYSQITHQTPTPKEASMIRSISKLFLATINSPT